jgi:hypothetical protein
MAILFRWLAPAVLATGLGFAALTPAPARADDELVRVLVDIADVVIRGGYPYYRHGGYGYNDRLIVERDRYGRPVYYRHVPRYRYGPPYGNAHGYWRNGPISQNVRCNAHGRCTVRYYDPRYDRYRYRHGYEYARHARYGDGYRWRIRDDDDDRYWDHRRQRWVYDD